MNDFANFPGIFVTKPVAAGTLLLQVIAIVVVLISSPRGMVM